jgi:hypothetical protein
MRPTSGRLAAPNDDTRRSPGCSKPPRRDASRTPPWVRGRSGRDCRVTPERPLKASALNPSYFGSSDHPGPTGSCVTVLAAIGCTGGRTAASRGSTTRPRVTDHGRVAGVGRSGASALMSWLVVSAFTSEGRRRAPYWLRGGGGASRRRTAGTGADRQHGCQRASAAPAGEVDDPASGEVPGANRPSVPLQAQTIEAQMGYTPPPLWASDLRAHGAVPQIYFQFSLVPSV